MKETSSKLNWKDLKMDDRFILISDEFDGYSESVCIVQEVYEDHLIVWDNGIEHINWIDEDSIIKPINKN